MRKARDFFVGHIISAYDWRLMEESILAYDRGYQPVLEAYGKVWFHFSCNLVLFKREWLEHYCEFAFLVAF